MSCVMSTVWKYGWFSMSGSSVRKASGLATMFFTACSLGTYMRVSAGMLRSV